ncbi:MAG: 50S ribosomal protein L18 [Planctomycetota bacterium]|nr:50S ribosomal protein L18 [Planctomycetota bacterium]
MDHLQQKKKWKKRSRKAMGVRRRLRAASDRPRLSVHRSAKNITVQLIDDLSGATLASAGTLDKSMADLVAGKNKTEAAQIVGVAIAERVLAAGVTEVSFDRSWHRYHGRVKALADSAREAGLKF